MSPRLLPILIAAATLAGGCAGIMQSLGMSRYTKEDVEKAYAAGDQAKLDTMCQADDSEHKFHTSRDLACEYAEALPQQLQNDAAYEAAMASNDAAALRDLCPATGKVAGIQYDHDTICASYDTMRMEHWNATTACGDLEPFWAEHWKDTQVPDEVFFQMADRKVACDDWDYVFQRISHVGSDGNFKSTGTLALKHLEDGGHDVYAQLMGWLDRTADAPFSFKHGDYAEMNIVDWLYATKKHDAHNTCKDLLPAAKKAPFQSRFLWYFSETGCTDATPLLVNRLASEKAAHRNQACYFLGTLGNKKHIKKMKPIAESDPEYKIEKGIKIYYIRDSCNEGINRIKTRS